MTLSRRERRVQLKTLSDRSGFATIEAMLEATVMDSVAPAICPRCGTTAEMEPDQDRGHCEGCGGQSVVGALVLAGLI